MVVRSLLSVARRSVAVLKICVLKWIVMNDWRALIDGRVHIAQTYVGGVKIGVIQPIVAR